MPRRSGPGVMSSVEPERAGDLNPAATSARTASTRRPVGPGAGPKPEPLQPSSPMTVITRRPSESRRKVPVTMPRMWVSRWSSSFCDPESHASQPQSGNCSTRSGSPTPTTTLASSTSAIALATITSARASSALGTTRPARDISSSGGWVVQVSWRPARSRALRDCREVRVSRPLPRGLAARYRRVLVRLCEPTWKFRSGALARDAMPSFGRDVLARSSVWPPSRPPNRSPQLDVASALAPVTSAAASPAWLDFGGCAYRQVGPDTRGGSQPSGHRGASAERRLCALAEASTRHGPAASARHRPGVLGHLQIG